MKAYVLTHFHALRTSKNHRLRKVVGVLLVIGGMLGFLPVLGYWMLPLGLALLSVDWPWARRLFRHLRIAWGRSYQRLMRWRARLFPGRR